MRAKDRLIGWAFMALWAIVAYFPLAIWILVFIFIIPVPPIWADPHGIYLWSLGLGAISFIWAALFIQEGSHFCTVKGPDRAEFERQLWKLK